MSETRFLILGDAVKLKLLSLSRNGVVKLGDSWGQLFSIEFSGVWRQLKDS